ncbi:hypothetical protein TSOC_005825 [Tetrabaena socialis]|uniref:Uncharacterized protein n=1 Tax=Tetrabaena socialis TaxID=47790 RepID=A0A2J8A586_9CHLO|nr:hypothetical protein TSOC_005825 [Tetrabaena socialis]|eukprot:PNH07689.1 hypothetical protein TSOC_005825 [Tetrabaena socialis]
MAAAAVLRAGLGAAVLQLQFRVARCSRLAQPTCPYRVACRRFVTVAAGEPASEGVPLAQAPPKPKPKVFKVRPLTKGGQKWVRNIGGGQNFDDALAKVQEIIDRAVEYVTPKEADPETIKRVKAQIKAGKEKRLDGKKKDAVRKKERSRKDWD